MEAALSSAVNALRAMNGLCGLSGPAGGANSTGLMLSNRATRAGVAACAGQTNPDTKIADIKKRITWKDLSHIGLSGQSNEI